MVALALRALVERGSTTGGGTDDARVCRGWVTHRGATDDARVGGGPGDPGGPSPLA